MKKSYLMIAAALIFAACAKTDTFKSEILDNETELIGFETFHGKATRAAITAPTGLTKDNQGNGGFGVYGYKHDGTKTATNGIVSVENTTNVFDNVQVWYESNTTPTRGFTYEVPKYWDKTKKYTFFAYAPYVAKATSTTTGIKFDEETGLFTRTDIKSLQATNKTLTRQTNSRVQYLATPDETEVTDYLIAPYVCNQEHSNTNQPSTSGNGYEKTVGFTFYHILSKLNVKVQVKDEFATGGHEYKGVQDIQVTKLNIENLPNVSEEVVYAQSSVEEGTSATVPAATYKKTVGGSALNFTTTLSMIDANDTNAATAGPLYILDGGSKNAQTGAITNPSDSISQQFHYYIAPNTPVEEAANDGHDKYKLNIDYKITYVDGTVDPFSRSIDLSDATLNATITQMEQNHIYNIIVTIALDQIYFDVNTINDWVNVSATEKELN